MIQNVSLTPAIFHLPEEVNEIGKTYSANPIIPRGPGFSSILSEVRENLIKAFEGGEDYEPVFFLSSGSGAVASAMGCCIDKNGILVISNGSYGERMAAFSRMYGHQTYHYELPYGEKPEPERIESLILAHKPSTLGIVHGATSSCHLNELDDIAELVRRYGLRWIVDGISTVFVEEIPLEKWGIDVLIGSSNKGLHSTPGIGFLLVKKSFLESVKRFLPKTPYFNLVENIELQKNLAFPFTVDPRLFLEMRAALNVFFQEGGLEGRIKTYRERNGFLRSEFKKMGLEIFGESNLPLQNIGTALMIPEGVALKNLMEKLALNTKHNQAYHVYSAQSKLSDKVFRVFNMGEYDMQTYRNFIEVLGDTLDDL